MFKSVYLDTNQYNKYCDINDLEKVCVFVEKINQKGYEIVLSPINIYEVICTQDELRREKLIFLFQHICSEKLLVGLEYLIIDFIVDHLDFNHLDDLRLENQFHQTQLSLVWKDVKLNKDRTFIFDTNSIEKIEVHKLFASLFYSLLSRGWGWLDAIYFVEDLTSKSGTEIKSALKLAVEKLRGMKRNPKLLNYKDAVMFFISTILLTGFTPNPKPIDEFWRKNNISSFEEKFEYLKLNLMFLFEHGPFVGMACLAVNQINEQYSRGNFFDCSHIAYLPYVDYFVTNDEKLVEFIQKEKNVSLFKRVISSINEKPFFIIDKLDINE